MKNYLLPVVLLLIALVLGVCYFYQNNKESLQGIPTISAFPSTVAKDAATSFTYINKKDGYQIVFPLSLESLLRVSPDMYGNQLFSLFSANIDYWKFGIHKFTLEEWGTMRNECGEPGSTTWESGCYLDKDILGRNETTIFVYILSEAGPIDDVTQNLVKDIDDTYVKNNFSIINN